MALEYVEYEILLEKCVKMIQYLDWKEYKVEGGYGVIHKELLWTLETVNVMKDAKLEVLKVAYKELCDLTREKLLEEHANHLFVAKLGFNP
jgi:hypothetical protein